MPRSKTPQTRRARDGGRADGSTGVYDASQITVLEGLEAVRRRPAMYIGSTGPRGLHHLLWEVVDNSVDEAMAGHATRIEIFLMADGGVRVTDNGRGIPVDTHAKTKESALTTVLTTLHAGGKFDSGAYTVSGGLHGVGVSVVNALSRQLDVEVVRDGHRWTQSFARGKSLGKVKMGKEAKRTGTTISYWHDPEIFEDEITYSFETVLARMRELAFLNRGLEIVLTDERDASQEPVRLHYSGGIVDFVKHLNSHRDPIHPHIIDIAEKGKEAELDLAMQWNVEYAETVLTFANNINTHEGGTHEEGFRKALTRAINDFAKSKGLLKEKETEVGLQGEDVREGLTAVVSVRVRQPQFEGQTKTKLGNTEIRSFVEVAINKALPEWLEKHPGEGRAIVEKCLLAARARVAARQARELTRRKSLLESGGLPGKLSDCSSRDASECELFIVEGDSAAGPAKQARDSRYQAILPIRGKIINVEKARLTKVLENKEIQALISAIGTNIGDEFDIGKARYHKIILLTDADVDGAHIRTLLLTFLFRHMQQLVDEGHVYIAQPPLFRVGTGKDAEYLRDDAALDAYTKARGNRKAMISRFKGLGEMNATELWDTTMDPTRRVLNKIEIDDEGIAMDRFGVLMGDDVESRRKFIQRYAKEVRFLDF